MRMKPLVTISSIVLAAGLSACGGDDGAVASKAEPVTKSADVLAEEGAASKGGLSPASRKAQAFTLVHTGPAESKTVSRIGLGETQTGQLTSSDPELDDGSYADLWELEVSSPTDVTIDLMSSDFDTYMLLMAGTPSDLGTSLASDDDGGEGTNSQIRGQIEPGSYTIVTNSFGGGAQGSYRLRVAGQGSGGGDASSGGVRGQIEPGSTVTGRLTSSDPTLGDGSHVHMWQFNGQAGQQATITLRSSDFDSYLTLSQGLGMAEPVASDDDGAGGLDSRISTTLPSNGPYTVIVNTLTGGETGSYELSLETSSTDWASEYPGGGDPNGKYAVLVGLDDYPGTQSDLRGPVDDAMMARDVLINRFGFPEENVVFLRDGEGTRMNIANAIARHLGQAGPNGTAVFFYSGHGTRLDENLGLAGSVDAESGNNVDEALAVHGGYILDEELGYLLQQIEARNTMVVIDACFSGTVTRAGGDVMAKFIPTEDAHEILTEPKSFIGADLGTGFGFGAGGSFEQAMSSPDRHILMAASSEDQLSWAIGSWPNREGPASLYSYYWASVMGSVPTSTSVQQIHSMVSDSVRRHVQQSRGRLDPQDPQLLGPNTGRSIGSLLGGS